MRSVGYAALVLALVSTPLGSVTRAQSDTRPRVFTEAAIRRAVSNLAADVLPQASATSDWSRIRSLPASSEITVSISGGPPKTYDFLHADDTALTVIDRESPGHPTIKIARDQVSEVQRRTGRRGSIIGAVIGAAAGVFVGVGTAIYFAQRQCGDSCTDEKVLIGLSIVGLPTAGGVLGYYLGGGNRTMTTVYKR